MSGKQLDVTKPFIAIIMLTLLAAFIVYAAVVWYRPIESNVMISGSHDLSITYPDTGEEAYTLNFGSISQYGSTTKTLDITYIGNLEQGVYVSWSADVLYQIALTSEYYDGDAWINWNKNVIIGPFLPEQKFQARWTLQDVGAYSGSYPFTLTINSHDEV